MTNRKNTHKNMTGLPCGLLVILKGEQSRNTSHNALENEREKYAGKQMTGRHDTLTIHQTFRVRQILLSFLLSCCHSCYVHCSDITSKLPCSVTLMFIVLFITSYLSCFLSLGRVMFTVLLINLYIFLALSIFLLLSSLFCYL